MLHTLEADESGITRDPQSDQLSRKLIPSDIMKKSLTLHIGMGKTGTTALQQFFVSNRKRLAHIGIDYPRFGAVSDAHHLLSPHIPNFLEGTWDFIPPEQWAPRIAAGQHQKVLLSSELMAWTAPEKLERFLRVVTDAFDVRVVIYLRRQDNIMMASYIQQVKAGTFRRPLTEVYENQRAKFDYDAVLKPWKQILGTDKIIVRPYEKSQFYEQDLRKDFLHHAFAVDRFEQFKFSSENPNPRLSIPTTHYKLKLNNVVLDPVQNARFSDLLLAYSEEQRRKSSAPLQEPTLLPPQLRLDLVKDNESINQMIAREYLGRQDGILFHDELPDPTRPDPTRPDPTRPDPTRPDPTRPDPEAAWDDKFLTTDEAGEIAAYLRARDPGLMDWLAAEVDVYRKAGGPVRREAADFLASSMQASGSWRPSSEKRLVLHAGTHKTGSSAIQGYLYNNQNRIVCGYLHRDRANSSLWILQAFKRDIAELPMFVHEQLTASDVEELRSRARSALKTSIMESAAGMDILSAESISTLDAGEISDLHTFFAQFYSKIELQLYFRPLKSRMESTFQEKLKHGRVTLEDRYPLRYFNLIKRLDEEFGRDRVHVYRYSPEDFVQRDVVQHFLQTLNLPHNGPRQIAENTALSLPAVQLLYIYRQHFPVFGQIDRAIVRKLGELKGAPIRFHSSLYEKLLAAGPGMIERFEARAGFSISEDIVQYDAEGIRTEQELTSVSKETLEWLDAAASDSSPADSVTQELHCIAQKVRSLGEPGVPGNIGDPSAHLAR